MVLFCKWYKNHFLVFNSQFCFGKNLSRFVIWKELYGMSPYWSVAIQLLVS